MKDAGTAVRLEPDEKRYLQDGAKKESPGADMPLSTFLRSAAHRRTKELVGADYEEWKAKEKRTKGSR